MRRSLDNGIEQGEQSTRLAHNRRACSNTARDDSLASPCFHRNLELFSV